MKVRTEIQQWGPHYGLSVSEVSAAKDSWELAEVNTGKLTTGGMITAGIGTAITGRGADLLCIDDPIKDAEEANSQTTREAHKDWYRSTSFTRLEPNATIALIMTRWHEDDLAGWLIREAKEEGEEWDVLNLPGLAEEKDELGREPGEALWPDRFPVERLQQIKAVSGPYWFACTPADSPVLMGDWKSKPIQDVRPGDEVVGFNPSQKDGESYTRSFLTPSRVKNIFQFEGEVWEYELGSGKKIRCTPDHRWYNRKPARGTHAYTPIIIGRSKLCYVAPPEDEATEHELRLWNWLAGIIDGEGHLTRSTIDISQSRGRNLPIFNRIKSVLDELGIAYNERHTERKQEGWAPRGNLLIRDARTVYRKLLRFTSAAKAEQIAELLFNYGRQFIRLRDPVIAGRRLGEMPVYALQTETGNYVVWGYASSNSQYQQRPAPLEGGLFKRSLFRYFEVDPEKGIYKLREENKTRLVPVGSGRRIMTVDLATSEKESADYTVCALGVITPDNDLLIEEVFREKVPGHELVTTIEAKYRAWRPDALSVESRGFQLSVVQMLARKGLPVRKLEAKGDKLARALPLAARFESGNVWFRQGASFLHFTEPELLGFPNALHDDVVDALAYLGLDQVYFGGSDWHRAYGIIRCVKCEHAFVGTPPGGEPQNCPRCGTPPLSLVS
jgi:predicted phage terminase large subunit-like protein